MFKKTCFLVLVLIVSGACTPAAPSPTAAPPSITAPTSIPSATTPPVNNLIDVEGSGLFVQPDGNVTISVVSASEPSWFCVQAEKEGQPGDNLGCTAVPAGENKDVAVKLDLSKTTYRTYLTLYVDKGTQGQMEIPNPDELALTATGIPVLFPEFLVGDLSWITVEDQSLGEGNTVLIPRVYTPIPALLVIHDGVRGPVIGWVTLQAGENLDVIVTLTSESKTNDLGAMLHWDGGDPGKYQNFDNDPPARALTTEHDGLVVVHFQLKLP